MIDLRELLAGPPPGIDCPRCEHRFSVRLAMTAQATEDGAQMVVSVPDPELTRISRAVVDHVVDTHHGRIDRHELSAWVNDQLHVAQQMQAKLLGEVLVATGLTEDEPGRYRLPD
jgi:hypothetical protein